MKKNNLRTTYQSSRIILIDSTTGTTSISLIVIVVEKISETQLSKESRKHIQVIFNVAIINRQQTGE